jgi:ATP phosphoribosyltransferase regulatory subunit HisZ
MALFDDILGKVGGHPELVNMAAKLGISPEQAEKAVAALGEAHQAPGDTVQLAAEKTGLDAGILSQVVEQIGGEGSLTRFAEMLDQDDDGSILDDIMGFANKFIRKG